MKYSEIPNLTNRLAYEFEFLKLFTIILFSNRNLSRNICHWQRERDQNDMEDQNRRPGPGQGRKGDNGHDAALPAASEEQGALHEVVESSS